MANINQDFLESFSMNKLERIKKLREDALAKLEAEIKLILAEKEDVELGDRVIVQKPYTGLYTNEVYTVLGITDFYYVIGNVDHHGDDVYAIPKSHVCLNDA